MSGTYKCDNTMAFQAGLPIDLLWVLDCYGTCKTRCLDPSICIRLESGLVLKKAIIGSDQELITLQHQWDETVRSISEMNPSNKDCYSRLSEMVQSRKSAVEEYGYLSACTPDT